MFNKEEDKRRRELLAAQAKEAKLREKLDALRRKTLSAKARLNSSTKHENWHAHRLAHLDRLAGYTGEMASARIYVRSLPFDDYHAALSPFAKSMTKSSILDIEFAAVQHHHEDWQQMGEELVLERERKAAEADLAGWEKFQRENPDSNWRANAMSRRQYFLIMRTSEQLGIEMPAGRMTRGQAHDWLQAHGANLRLNRDRDEVITNGNATAGDEIAQARAQSIDKFVDSYLFEVHDNSISSAGGEPNYSQHGTEENDQ